MPDIHPTARTAPTATQPIHDGTYEVDPQQSAIDFKAKAFCLMWVTGNIPVEAGRITILNGKVHASGELAAHRIATGLAPRDWHLRSSHYLKTKTNPTIAVKLSDHPANTPTVELEVTVKGKPAQVAVQTSRIEATADQITLTGTSELDRTVFPMLPPVAGVSKKVQIRFTVVATRRANRP